MKPVDLLRSQLFHGAPPRGSFIGPLQTTALAAIRSVQPVLFRPSAIQSTILRARSSPTSS
jgi:hypothetical protein